MDYSSKAKSFNVHYFATPIGIVQYGRVHTVVAGTTTLHTIRSALPMAIPFIVADLGLSANHSAKLLAAFFSGYVITQIPEGRLAEIVGGKGRSFPYSAEGNDLPRIPKRLQPLRERQIVGKKGRTFPSATSTGMV